MVSLPSPWAYFEIQVTRLIHHREGITRNPLSAVIFHERRDDVQRSKRTVKISGRERSNSRTPREERRSLRGSSDRLPGILSLLTSCGPCASFSPSHPSVAHFRSTLVFSFFPILPSPLLPFRLSLVLFFPLSPFSLSKRVN